MAGHGERDVTGHTTLITGGAATTGATAAAWTETMPAGAGAVSMGEWNTVGGYGG